jgi:DNA-binding transcriptional LysR family regulator
MLLVEKELRLATRPDVPPAGRVRLGVIESVVHTWLTGLIRQLAQRYPDIELDLTVDTSRNLREQFGQRRLDLIIQNNPVETAGDEFLSVTPLCHYPLNWIGRPGILPRRRLKSEDLLHASLLTFSRHSTQHAQLCALFADRDNEPRVNTFPSVAAILKLTMEGFGLAAIPPVFVKQELGKGKLVQYAGPRLPGMDVSVAHGSMAGRAVITVAHLSRETVSDYCQSMGRPWVLTLGARASKSGQSSNTVRRLAGALPAHSKPMMHK